jgi:diguanylate cyclase (GGDEF)-like protein
MLEPSGDIAYSLGKRLRAFDLAYRLGGEEFVVLLPGADARQSAVLAEGLRETILAARHGGLPVTMSFGVSASQPSSFDYDHAFRAADQALYAAKAAGRNCVRIAGAPDVSLRPLEETQSREPEAILQG